MASVSSENTVRANILYCWEFGGGSGHLHMLAAVGASLTSRGYKFQAAVRNVVDASRLKSLQGVDIFQCPTQPDINRAIAPAANYAEVLFQAGMNEADVVTALLRSWRNLISALQPKLLITEYSPVAQLAAYTLQIPCLVIGTGFTVPPPESPMPGIQPWLPTQPTARMKQSEEAVLQALNIALRRCSDQPELASIGDLYATENTLITSLPELDHYQRSGGNFSNGLLSLPNADHELEPVWPAVEGPKVLAYYHGEYPTFELLTTALLKTRWPTLVLASHVQADLAQHLNDQPLINLCEPKVDFEKALASADLVITAGGHNASAQALMAGKALLVAPFYIEQALQGYRLANQGLALSATGDLKELDIQALYEELYKPKRVALRREFAARYDERANEQAMKLVTQWIEGYI